MKFTKLSQKMFRFFNKNQHVAPIEPTKATLDIMKDLYKDILNAHDYVSSFHGNNLYYIKTKKIQTASEITKPNNFNFNSFPESVRNHINETASSEISYTFSLYHRNVKVIFVLEESDVEMQIPVFNKYIEAIIMWLHILNEYASTQCSNSLVIYLYFTSLEKKLPDSSIDILDEIHVNTAFTTTCPKESEIVIYRKEEWFKVLIHETFHNFGLDFSGMNMEDCKNRILTLFPVNSEVNLYESYAECWAEIMNSAFCSFFLVQNAHSKSDFYSNWILLIQFERMNSFFQMVKALRFMGLTYDILYSKKKANQVLRETLYKENTNVLSYYVIKTILLNNYTGFLGWCKKHNLSLLQFKKTTKNVEDFCVFIEKNYKKESMLEGVYNNELFLTSFKKSDLKKHEFMLNTMRMSLCEMG